MVSLFMGARVKKEDKKGRIPYKTDMCRNYYFKSGTIVNNDKDNYLLSLFH